MGSSKRTFTRAAAVGVVGALVLAGAQALAANAAQSVADIEDSTPEALVALLVGDDTPVSNVSFTGSPAAAGTFSEFDFLGVPSGVVLSTGFIEAREGRTSSLLGPNSGSGVTGYLEQLGDPDLDAIVDPLGTNDATVLEFDFVPSADTITFTYVFGSEEYLEYVDSNFNDVFAFFVNGVNYATIDTADGKLPVTINNINHLRNTEYFVDNSMNPAPYDTQLDGFTVPLSFEAPVNEGVTNTIKLAIADTADFALDSVVLLRAGSFRANTPPVAEDLAGLSVRHGGTLPITLGGTDADEDPLTFALATPPAAEAGTVTVNPDGTASFVAAPDFTGEATFTFTVNDGSVSSPPVTVSINVTEAGVVPTPTPTPTPTATATPTPAPTATATPTAAPSPTATAAGKASGNLPTTGGELPVIALGAALLLLAAGGVLLVRRRKTS